MSNWRNSKCNSKHPLSDIPTTVTVGEFNFDVESGLDILNFEPFGAHDGSMVLLGYDAGNRHALLEVFDDVVDPLADRIDQVGRPFDDDAIRGDARTRERDGYAGELFLQMVERFAAAGDEMFVVLLIHCYVHFFHVVLAKRKNIFSSTKRIHLELKV